MVSVVIPVYHSARIVGTTIDRVVAVCEAQDWDYEIIAVDDASRDGTLQVLQAQALRHARVRVLPTRVNAGQQHALLVGLREATGDIAVCMDDDLQHRPESIPDLVRAVRDGHDAVFARFERPRHARWRRIGSEVVRAIDQHVFGAPRWLQVTSFRAIGRPVIDRVCAYRGGSPYVRGQILLACRAPANVVVEHQPRSGAGSYSVTSLVGVVLRVLFEWSVVPAGAAGAAGLLWLVAGTGLWATATPVGRAVAPLAWLQGVSLAIVGAWAWHRSKKRGVASFEARGEGPHALGRRV